MSFNYINAAKQENPLALVFSNSRKANFSLALAFIAMGICIAAIIVASGAKSAATRDQTSQIHLMSEVILPSPHAHYLGATAIDLAMVLPNDLSDYVGKVYRVWATSAKPHKVTIASGGKNPEFCGDNVMTHPKIATFGGAIGDGFVFEVVADNKVVIIAVNNVQFS